MRAEYLNRYGNSPELTKVLREIDIVTTVLEKTVLVANVVERSTNRFTFGM